MCDEASTNFKNENFIFLFIYMIAKSTSVMVLKWIQPPLPLWCWLYFSLYSCYLYRYWHLYLRENMNPPTRNVNTYRSDIRRGHIISSVILVLNYEKVVHSCSNTCLFFCAPIVGSIPNHKLLRHICLIKKSNQCRLTYDMCRLPI